MFAFKWLFLSFCLLFLHCLLIVSNVTCFISYSFPSFFCHCTFQPLHFFSFFCLVSFHSAFTHIHCVFWLTIVFRFTKRHTFMLLSFNQKSYSLLFVEYNFPLSIQFFIRISQFHNIPTSYSNLSIRKSFVFNFAPILLHSPYYCVENKIKMHLLHSIM